eukprot:1493943-Rhodomonas_salina.4
MREVLCRGHTLSQYRASPSPRVATQCRVPDAVADCVTDTEDSVTDTGDTVLSHSLPPPRLPSPFPPPPPALGASLSAVSAAQSASYPHMLRQYRAQHSTRLGQ